MTKQISILVLTAITVLASCNNIRKADIVDENFETFFTRFNKDSIFQMSRVNFPVIVEEFDVDDLQQKIKTIEQNDYQCIDLSYDDSFKDRALDKYTQTIKVNRNKATVEIRGIDNVIYNDILFERIDGKWKLIGWKDSST